MRDRQIVAPIFLFTRCIQPCPKLAVYRRINVTHRRGNHVFVSKDNVAMIVGCAWRARVFIGDKAGEFTRGIR